MGLFQTNRSNDPASQRKRLGNMRVIIVLATAYILYDGIKLIREQESTPIFFYIYLVVFALAMVFSFFLNAKRIKQVDELIAKDLAGEVSAEETPKKEWPDDLKDVHPVSSEKKEIGDGNNDSDTDDVPSSDSNGDQSDSKQPK